MVNRIFIYPYDQHSEGATKVARALECQKLLRKGSRYQHREGDVIINWGASDCPYPWAINADLKGTIDKRTFFDRTFGSEYVPHFCVARKGMDRVGQAKAAGFIFPVLCRTKVKAHDGDGIVIAENADQLVDAPLYVELCAKTAEYRVHMARKDGQVEILGVQQKFLPKERKDKDIRIRTTANGCYFAWTVDGEPVVLPMQATLACMEVFDRFPELTFGGFDVIYNKPTNEAYVIEINSAPELTDKAAEMYADFFDGFRRVDEPVVAGPQQLDYAGEVLPVGKLRDPIYEDDANAVDVMNAVIKHEQELLAEIDKRAFNFWLGAPEPEAEPEAVVEEAAPKAAKDIAFGEWYGEYVQARGKNEFEDCKLAFEAGWKARKEADYALIYNG